MGLFDLFFKKKNKNQITFDNTVSGSGFDISTLQPLNQNQTRIQGLNNLYKTYGE